MITTEITTDITTAPVINLTNSAAAKVAELLAREGDDQLALRVAVRTGGCSESSYEIFFGTGTGTGTEDREAVFGTVKVRVDPASAEHVVGTTLAHRVCTHRAGPDIQNPSAQRSCGCGQSLA